MESSTLKRKNHKVKSTQTTINNKGYWIGFSIALVVLLSGCPSMAVKKTSEPPIWANERLLTSPKCNNINKDNIISFAEKYFQQVTTKFDKNNLEAAENDYYENYILSAAVINRSLLCIAHSLELKDAIEQLESERRILLGGTTNSKKQIKLLRTYSDNARQEIEAKLKKRDEISPEQKRDLALAFILYAGGTHYAYEVFDSFKNYGLRTKQVADSINKKIEEAPIMEKPELIVLYGQILLDATGMIGMAKEMTTHGLKVLATGLEFRKFLESKNVKLDPDATNQLEQVGWT